MSEVVVLAVPGAIPPTPFECPHNPYVSVAKFRADMVQFEDETIYTDHSVQTFLNIAGCLVSPNYWGTLTVTGQELVCAHFLALQQYSILRTQGGGVGGAGVAVPGLPIGLMNSKSVSKVSVSYDYSSSTMEGWGPWNLTTFGQQYAFFAQMVGTGGIEILSIGFESSMVGIVNSYAHGVMRGYYGSTG